MPATHQQTSTPADLANSYAAVRQYTENICAPLETEDYIPQPSVDVSPPKWNIAHTTWFFEEMILKAFSENYQEFNPNFGFLFNSYYNSIGTRTVRDHRGDLSRPTVKEVFQYRKFVDGKMLELLNGEVSKELRKLVVLGLNHEQQHQELLLTDIKYTFSCNPTFPVYDDGEILEEKGAIESDESLEVTGGIYKIGYEGDGFCFDNELGRHRVYLQDFTIRKNLVTNGEFLEFIEDGGYQDFRFWHAEGWDWVNQNEIKSPLYWHNIDGEWFQFTLGGLRKLNLKNPVCHVSFYEAAAFADWKRMRLPTEFEWEAASEQLDWGLRWEWTNSAYLPYPHFKKAKGALGEYNGKFMINQTVLRGASVVTPPNHSRRTYRNFFHPPLRWQFTGIRLAK
ncbi:MAG: ergothioneine biosynthesis protein EgtB [Pyrinomonadaceae bacterium]|nr:ergothioneine biosynthesis protein EgtB [Pyrinomonadaceae bacterium]